MMATDDTIIDAGTAQQWLADEAQRLSEAMAVRRVHEERVECLLALLLSINTPPDELVSLLPQDVAQAKRKLIGLSREPGLLDPRRGRVTAASGTFEAPRPADEPGALLERARARVRSPHQAAVLEKIATTARRENSMESIGPAAIAKALQADGVDIHPETVRRSLDHLSDDGFLRKIEPGRYTLTPQAAASLFRAEGAE